MTGGGGSGDGFVRCSDGEVRWGRFGAAGVVFVVREGDGPRVLLQLRSAMSHEGGTWSCPGGAIDADETPETAALREAVEEVGTPPAPWQVVGEHVFAPATDWTYTTIVIEVSERFGRARNFESSDVGWVTPGEVDGLSLHAGFAAAWPRLRAIVEQPV